MQCCPSILLVTALLQKQLRGSRALSPCEHPHPPLPGSPSQIFRRGLIATGELHSV